LYFVLREHGTKQVKASLGVRQLDWGIPMILLIPQDLPNRGKQYWALCCALLFILSQLMWTIAGRFRRYDWIELPLIGFYFPLAPFFDPRDGMVRDPNLFFYALACWLGIFGIGLLFLRKKINPLLPILIILVLCAVSGIVFSTLTKPLPKVAF